MAVVYVRGVRPSLVKRLLFATVTLLTAGASYADTLVTPSFRIEITVNCAEGNVTCDDVTYVGTSKRSGEAISLHGKTMHSMCADGVTPCHFQGYEFKSGTTRYIVLESGELIVKQGQKVLVQEHGEWQQ